MGRSTHTEAQMAGAVKQVEAGGEPKKWFVRWECRSMIYRWKEKYGRVYASEG